MINYGGKMINSYGKMAISGGKITISDAPKNEFPIDIYIQ